MKIEISPSILSADFGRLQEEIDLIKNADRLHVDVMDNHLVPNLSMGPAIQNSISTRLMIETHLMVDNPENIIPSFAEAGSKRILVHVEIMNDDSLLKAIRKAGCEPGIVLNPNTPLSDAEPYLDKVEQVLLMTVNPGFGGQQFISSVVPKIKDLRRIFSKDIEVDGGINFETADKCVSAGANVLVSGSFIFSNREMSPSKVIDGFRERFR